MVSDKYSNQQMRKKINSMKQSDRIEYNQILQKKYVIILMATMIMLFSMGLILMYTDSINDSHIRKVIYDDLGLEEYSKIYHYDIIGDVTIIFGLFLFLIYFLYVISKGISMLEKEEDAFLEEHTK